MWWVLSLVQLQLRVRLRLLLQTLLLLLILLLFLLLFLLTLLLGPGRAGSSWWDEAGCGDVRFGPRSRPGG